MGNELKYVPATRTVKVGDTLAWRNSAKSVAHTATDDPIRARKEACVGLPEGAQPWDSGIIGGGESWSRRFDVPGESTYFCIPRELAGMIASITVER